MDHKHSVPPEPRPYCSRTPESATAMDQNIASAAQYDAGIKQAVGAYYKRAWDEQAAPRYRSGEPAHAMSRERILRLLDAAEYLAADLHEAPVWIVPCLEGGAPTRTSGSSIYSAVRNMLLACRSLGLGTVITTNHIRCEDEVKALLGIPEDVDTFALMPIGWPIDKFGPVTRRPLAEVVHADRWRGD
jgi:nitroreductase